MTLPSVQKNPYATLRFFLDTCKTTIPTKSAVGFVAMAGIFSVFTGRSSYVSGLDGPEGPPDQLFSRKSMAKAAGILSGGLTLLSTTLLLSRLSPLSFRNALLISTISSIATLCIGEIGSRIIRKKPLFDN